MIETLGLSLRVTPYSETSLVVRLLTADGMVSVLARGAMRPKNSLGGVADELVLLEVTFTRKRGHDPLHTLTRARQERWFPGLRSSLAAFYGAQLVREILLALPTPESDAPDTLDLALRALEALEQARSPLGVGARLMASLLRLHGLTPEFEQCVVSGQSLSRGAATFSLTDFGLIAPDVSRAARDTRLLSPEVLELLRLIFRKERAKGEFHLETWLKAFMLCRSLLEAALGRELRSANALLTELARRA